MSSEAYRIDDVAKLSNSQLFDELQRLGIPAGPVVDSTRSMYEKKLLTKLSELRQSPVSSLNYSPKHADVPTSNTSFRANSVSDFIESERSLHKTVTERFPRNSSSDTIELNDDEIVEEITDANTSFYKRQSLPPTSTSSSLFQSDIGRRSYSNRPSTSELLDDIRKRAALAGDRIQARSSYQHSDLYQQSGRIFKSETIKSSGPSKANSMMIKIFVGLILFGIMYYVMTYTIEKPKIEFQGDADRMLAESGYENED